MSEVELALAFLAGVGMGIALDRWLLPPPGLTSLAVELVLADPPRVGRVGMEAVDRDLLDAAGYPG